MTEGYFELPPSWEWVRVSDAGAVRLGRQRSPEHQSGKHMRPYLRVANVHENRIDTSDILEMNFSPADTARFLLVPGDILLNEGQSRELVGRPAMFRGEVPGACFQNTLIRFRAHPGVTEPAYALSVFRYYLRAGFFQKICKWTTNIAHLGAERFSAMPFPLAPLAEQKRIADKLDALLARVSACRHRLDRFPAILERFRQSVLAAATSGDLTREWRESRGEDDGTQEFEFSDADVFRRYTFPKSWSQARLSEMADITGGVTKDSKRQSADFVEVPYLRVANVQRGYLDLSEVKTIRVPHDRVANLLLQEGDVLFNEGGDIDKLGRGWVWNGELPRCIFQNHVFRARLHDRAYEPRWFSWFGNSRGFEYFLARGKQTTNLASISKRVLSELPVAVPPADEQREIVRRVHELLQAAGSLERRCVIAASLVAQMTPSAFARAFRGQLVPQDAGDEPAEALMKRLGAELESQQVPGERSTTTPLPEAGVGGETMKTLLAILTEAKSWLSAQEAFHRCGVSNGTSTEDIEALYAELKALEADGRVEIAARRDAAGKKVEDRLRLVRQ